MVVKQKKGKAILGISAYYHDSAAALVVDGEVIAAAHEERFTRKKHDSSFPSRSISYCLSTGEYSLNDLAAVVFYDKPLLKFERILETCLLYTPKGIRQFLSSMTLWVKEKLFLERAIIKELRKIGNFDKKKTRLLFSEHHLSHAASAFYPSPFEESAILTIDGVGEWATASICYGRGRNLELLKELHFPHSLGLLYSAFTYYLGFEVNGGEYKLMGLAPYGEHGAQARLFKERILNTLVRVRDDGSIFLDQQYFDYASGLKMVDEKKWRELFGFSRRKPTDDLRPEHCNLALAIQGVTEEVMIRMARHAKELTGSRYLCLAGGVALNCVGNSKILQEGIFKDIWIQPAAGDAGGALGAAFAAYHIYFSAERVASEGTDAMQGAYLGPSFSDAEIEVALRGADAVWEQIEGVNLLCATTAKLLSEGNVIGWFQGRMEWGPRALGNRSILADPRNPEMQKRLNLMIKFREGFRPFAPSVLAEDSSKYFEFIHPSPYMLFIAPVKASRRKPEPSNYASLPWREKLYHIRSDIPSVTHLDYSARLQTVSKGTAPLYHRLIAAFKKETGYGMLVNTSFNVRDEPIVCTPMDAYRCFMATHIDYLVMGAYLLKKSEQRTVSKVEEKNP